MDALLVDRSCDNSVYQACLVVLHRTFERQESGPAAFRRRLAEVYLYFLRIAFYHVQASLGDVLGRGNGGEGNLAVDCFAMVSRRFRRTINDRRTNVQHSRFGESLEDDFVPDSVNIAVGDAHSHFMSFHTDRISLMP